MCIYVYIYSYIYCIYSHKCKYMYKHKNQTSITAHTDVLTFTFFGKQPTYVNVVNFVFLTN